MNKFDQYAKELGWKKPYKEIPLFFREDDNYLTVAFSIADVYESYNKENISKEQTQRAISIFSHNKFKKNNRDWAIPLIASDYFTHKFDYVSAAKYAKKVIEIKPDISVASFVKPVQKLLI